MYHLPNTQDIRHWPMPTSVNPMSSGRTEMSVDDWCTITAFDWMEIKCVYKSACYEVNRH